MKVIILAGGFATRLWPLTEHTAKPLLQIAGKPIISYLVEMLPPELPIIVSTNAVFGDAFHEWRNDFGDRDITIFIEDSDGEEHKKGALAAVALVMQRFEVAEDILVLAGDNLFCFDIHAFLEKCKNVPLLAACDIGSTEEAKRFGVVVPGEGTEIAAFQEKPAHPNSTLVCTGCMFFPERLLGEITDYSKNHSDDIGGIFEYFLKQKERADYFRFDEPWFDIGSFGAFLQAQRFVIGERVIDRSAKQSGKNTFGGSVYLGNDVQIENAVLENAIVEDGAIIRNASVRNSVIAKNAVVSGVDLSGVALRAESFVAAE